MHEILLPACDLSSPSKSDGFECPDNIAVVFKGPHHAGTPLTSTNQMASGPELKTLIIQAVQFRIDIDGCAEGMITEPRAISGAVDRTARLEHMVTNDRNDWRAVADQALKRSPHLGRYLVTNRKGTKRRDADTFLIFSAYGATRYGVDFV